MSVPVPIRPEDIPAPVRELCQKVAEAGYRAWVVGGCLRDLLRGETASDWDLASDARPEDVQRIFPRVIPTGIQHGTVTVRHRGQSFELTTLRGEGAYSDGRRPDRVEFVRDIREDLARRDFTVNALAYDPIADHLEDPFQGLADLAAGVIRAVGHAEERFAEDGLRVLRAARFAATLEFSLDSETEAAIRPTLDTFRKVSAERVREEWVKALKARAPSRAFEIMARTGILEITFEPMFRLSPPTWAGSMRAVDTAPPDVCMRLAGLFFPLSVAAVRDWLVRYRFSNQERERVVHMLEHAAPGLPAGAPGQCFRLVHATAVVDRAKVPAADAPDPDLRRYARRVGRDHLDEVTRLGQIATAAFYGPASRQAREAHTLRERVRRLVDANTPLATKELAVSGRDLMQVLGLAPGPQLGRILDGLLERVLDAPELNQRATLLEIARDLCEER